MSEVVIVAIISFCGTLVGAFGAARLSNFRIEQLEKKVEKHNNVIERMYRIEGRMTEVEHDVAELKKEA